MDRQLPYEISYKTIAFWRNIENGFLWSTFICSILLQTFQINCISHSLDSIKWIANLFNVLNYYDNDSIEKGPYKMLVNCYENCFFTYNIIKVMLPKMAIKNTILFGLLLIFAYYGIKDNVVAIPFLQLFLSSLFLIELIYHIAFFFRLKNLCDKFKQIFSTPKSTKNKTIQDAIYMVLEYETTLAYNKSPNSNSVYKKLNNKLTEEWSCIKQNYDIR